MGVERIMMNQMDLYANEGTGLCYKEASWIPFLPSLDRHPR
jgi:hypothetical protein